MVPAKSNTYVPAFTKPESPPDLDYIRQHGVILAIDEKGKTGLAQVTKGLVVSYVGVTIVSDGGIGKVIRRRYNRYIRVN